MECLNDADMCTYPHHVKVSHLGETTPVQQRHADNSTNMIGSAPMCKVMNMNHVKANHLEEIKPVTT